MSETSGARESSARWLTRVLALPKDSPVRTLMVTLVVSFCCAVLVAGTAIGLRPQYQLNQELNRQRNILAAAALLTPEKDVQELFEQVEPRVVDLVTGNYAARSIPRHSSASKPGLNRREVCPYPVISTLRSSRIDRGTQSFTSFTRSTVSVRSFCPSTVTGCGRPCTAISR